MDFFVVSVKFFGEFKTVSCKLVGFVLFCRGFNDLRELAKLKEEFVFGLEIVG